MNPGWAAHPALPGRLFFDGCSLLLEAFSRLFLAFGYVGCLCNQPRMAFGVALCNQVQRPLMDFCSQEERLLGPGLSGRGKF